MTDRNESDIQSGNGGLSNKSLLDLVDHVNTEQEEPVVFEHSAYMNNEVLVDTLKKKTKVFKVLALNCQSMFAKYDQLSIYVHLLQEQGCSFDAICLQESWIDDSMDIGPLNISGYNLISKSRTCSSHGGLAIYLKCGFQ